MSDLQWQKDRCVEWLLAKWTEVVSPERTKQWASRLSVSVTDDQLAATIAEMDRLRDDELSDWLLNRAELWQQSLLLDRVTGLIRRIDDAADCRSDAIQAVALHVRDGDSLRSVLRRMLEACRPARE